VANVRIKNTSVEQEIGGGIADVCPAIELESVDSGGNKSKIASRMHEILDLSVHRKSHLFPVSRPRLWYRLSRLLGVIKQMIGLGPLVPKFGFWMCARNYYPADLRVADMLTIVITHHNLGFAARGCRQTVAAIKAHRRKVAFARFLSRENNVLREACPSARAPSHRIGSIFVG
jgi:hypothetical protein